MRVLPPHKVDRFLESKTQPFPGAHRLPGRFRSHANALCVCAATDLVRERFLKQYHGM